MIMLKKILVLILMCCTFNFMDAQEITEEQWKFWNPIMDALEQVESGGNEKAVSPNGKWVGCLQIATICVREVNRILGKQVYTYKDRYSRQKSREMFIIFQEKYNPERNMERAARLWNSGDLRCMERKASTNEYYRRFSRFFNLTT
jgi:hypothetical protein